MVNQEQGFVSFFSIKEFAREIGMHPNTIRRAIKNGRISAFRIGSGKKAAYRIAKTEIQRIAILDLDQYIEKIVEERIKKLYE